MTETRGDGTSGFAVELSAELSKLLHDGFGASGTPPLAPLTAVFCVYRAAMLGIDELDVDVTTPELEAAAHVTLSDPLTWRELIEDIAARLAERRPRGDGTAALALACRTADGGGLLVEFESDSTRLDSEAAAGQQERLRQLLATAAADPDAQVHAAELVTERDRELLLEQWNDTATALPALTVPQLFEWRVADAPDAVALDSEAGVLTYAELSAAANGLARRLTERGVRPGDHVGVLMSRSAELVVAIVALAKAGAVYVPLDPRYPVARMRLLLANVDAALLLTDAAAGGHEIAIGRKVLTFALDDQPGGATPGPAADHRSDPHALLQVIHTSGSTGEPKGVEVTHANAVSFALDRAWRGGPEHRALFHSPHAWDAVTLEVLLPLLIGGRVVVAAEEVNAVLLRRLADAGRISVLWLTAGLFGALAEGDPGCLAGLSQVWTGGDIVSPRAVARVAEACPELELYNGYGPAETTVFSTRHRIDPARPAGRGIPIGAPMDNMRVHVLDRHLRLLPPGAVGQVYVAGAGLARGYAGLAELTGERFPVDPFDRAGRVYATGDLARWEPDGELSFVGRVDGQVKVRGFRIEPGEIEAVLVRHPAVARAVATVHKTDDGSGAIHVHAVPAGSESAPSPEQLHEFLSELLPRYMVPDRIVIVPEIPLTARGKVDRERLAELSAEHDATRDAALGADPAQRAYQDSIPLRNLAEAVRLRGALDPDALRAALADVSVRHAGLRIATGQGEADTPEVVRVVAAQLPKALAEAVHRQVGETAVRAQLIVLDEQDRVLVLSGHPNSVDCASLTVIGRELGIAYAARVGGRAPQWSDPAPSQSELVARRRRILGSPDDPDSTLNRQSAYWAAALAGLPAESRLPADHPRPATPTNRCGEAVFRIDEALHQDLHAAARCGGTGIEAVLQTALAALLSRFGAGADVAFGIPSRRAGADAVGPLENLLVVRADTGGDPTFAELLLRVHDAAEAAAANGDVPFGLLLEHLAPPRVAGRHPLCQVFLRVLPQSARLPQFPGLRAEPQPTGADRSPFDLTIVCRPAESGGVDGVVEFNRDLFSFATAQSLADGFTALLRAVVAEPSARLGEPRIGTAATETSDLTTMVERELSDLWSELLEVRVTSRDASFWDLGGYSTLGLTLAARIRERFDVGLRLRELFRMPRLGDLADRIEAEIREKQPGAALSEAPASAFQQQIRLAEKLQPEPGLYNVPLAWRLSEPLDPERLAAALARIVERHEALRTVFADRGGTLTQIIGPAWLPGIRVLRCADGAELEETLRVEADARFDLAAGPLLRAALVETPSTRVLALTVHHIVFDVASARVLTEEIDRFYREPAAGSDGPAAEQFRNLVAELEGSDPDALDRTAERLRGAPSRLPLAAPDPAEPHGVVPLALGADMLRRLRPVQDEAGVSWFVAASAALALALHRWTGADDVTFGFPVDTRAAGRSADVVGPCLSTVAVRSRHGVETTVAQLLDAVRDDVLDAMEDRHVPFGAVVERLNPPRYPGTTPYFDVMLAPQVQTAAETRIGDSVLTPVSMLTGTVGKFAVSVSLIANGDGLTGRLPYRGDRVPAAAVRELADLLADSFEAVLGDRGLRVADLVAAAKRAGSAARSEPVRARAAAAEPVGAGTAAVERRVAAIWSRLLGVESVGPQQNFFDIGGNSLKLVSLHAELCREFDLAIPIQRLFENSTVATMARFLRQAGGTGPEPAEPQRAAEPGDRLAARRDLLARRAQGR